MITLSLAFILDFRQTFEFPIFACPRVFHMFANQSWYYKPKLPGEKLPDWFWPFELVAVNDNVHILSIIIRKVEKPWLGVEADPSWLLGYRPACGSIKMWCTADSCHIRHHRSLLGRIAISVKPNLRRPQPFVSMVGSDFLPWSRLQLQGKLSGRLEQYNEFEFCEKKNTLKYASFYLPVVRVWNM